MCQEGELHHEYTRWAVFLSGVLVGVCNTSTSTDLQHHTPTLEGDVESLLQIIEGTAPCGAHHSASTQQQTDEDEKVGLSSILK